MDGAVVVAAGPPPLTPIDAAGPPPETPFGAAAGPPPLTDDAIAIASETSNAESMVYEAPG
jgi:hypothetical protein